MLSKVMVRTFANMCVFSHAQLCVCEISARNFSVRLSQFRLQSGLFIFFYHFLMFKILVSIYQLVRGNDVNQMLINADKNISMSYAYGGRRQGNMNEKEVYVVRASGAYQHQSGFKSFFGILNEGDLP